jgi:hypothetical protein
MADLFTYIANDAICLSAVEDLERNRIDAITWLGEYLELFINVTYQPKGRARVADCYYGGQHYDGISKFADLYVRLHDEHQDLFSYGENEDDE